MPQTMATRLTWIVKQDATEQERPVLEDLPEGARAVLPASDGSRCAQENGARVARFVVLLHPLAR